MVWLGNTRDGRIVRSQPVYDYPASYQIGLLKAKPT
jgi:hypothetical protein